MRKLVLGLLVGALLLAGCGPSEPLATSDSAQRFGGEARVPVDDGVYRIVGTVIGEVSSLTRQTQSAHGSISGFSGNGSGYVGGSYFGPEFKGKGFVRLLVSQSDSNLAPVGSVALLKSTDTKASALLPGDQVVFKCRHQYEAVAAVREGEAFDGAKLATWELDYCRLAAPQIVVTGTVSLP